MIEAEDYIGIYLGIPYPVFAEARKNDPVVRPLLKLLKQQIERNLELEQMVMRNEY